MIIKNEKTINKYLSNVLISSTLTLNIKKVKNIRLNILIFIDFNALAKESNSMHNNKEKRYRITKSWNSIFKFRAFLIL